MLKLKSINDTESNQIGWSIIILWLFSFTLSYNIVKGDHITLGFCVGPIEISLGLSIWRKLLP